MMAIKRNPQLCTEIREAKRKWYKYFKNNIDQYHMFMNFVLGDQWTDTESRLFEDYQKKPFTINQVGTMANHLLGEQRQNTPNMQVQPTKDTDENTVEIREALVKDISFSSHADVVYQNTFQQEVVGGFSALRVGSEYENNDSFNQVLRVYGFKDPTKCYWDIAAESPCKTDGLHAGYVTRMSREKFKNIYGAKIEREIPPAQQDDEPALAFSDEDAIIIIDHYKREYSTKKLYQLSNGDIISEDEFKKLEKSDIDGNEMLLWKGEPVLITNQRISPIYKIKHYKIAGDFVLETNDFPGDNQQLPVIFADQNSYYDKNGKQICRPFFKDAYDLQKYLNYLVTQSAYLIKISRYDQYIAPRGCVSNPNTANMWRNPSKVQGALIYDEVPSGEKPQRLDPPELSQSLIQQHQQCILDLQRCTGMYDTQLGDQGNENSGVAIDARTERGSYNTFTAFSSLNRTITVSSEIIDEAIPYIYDTERTLMLNLKSSGTKAVTINKQIDEYGVKIQNDMTKGKFKVRIVPGPSTQGQQEQNLRSLDMIQQKDPELFRLIADLYAENLPMSNNIEIRNRLKTIVPEDVIKAGKTGEPIQPKPSPPDPQMMAVMGELKNSQQEIALKQQQLQMNAKQAALENEIKMQQLEAEKQEAAAKLQEIELRYAAETHKTDTDAHIAHANNLVKILTHKPQRENKHYEH